MREFSTDLQTDIPANRRFHRCRQAALIAASALLSLSLYTADADAAPALRLDDGSNVLTIIDQGVNDLSAQAGGIAFIGNFGSFIFNVTGASTKPLIGSASEPRMDLSSLNVTGTTAGSLQLFFTDTDFIGSGGPINFISGIGGATAGLIQFDAYASASNLPFATDILLGSSGLLNGVTFSYENTSDIALSGNYSLTTVVTIIHNTGGLNSSVNAVIEIPEPAFAPAILGGALLVGARLAGRRRRRNA